MRSGCLLKVRIDFLNEDGFGLWDASKLVSSRQSGRHESPRYADHTCTFALQRAVMLVILPPETPGGFRASID